MSEQFTADLRDLLARTAAAPEARLDAAVPAIVARARRMWRARAAGVTLATAAVVVGIGVAGTAAVRALDPAPPAWEPVTTPPDGPVSGSRLGLACGMPIADLQVFTDPPGEIAFRPVATTVPRGTPLVGDLEYAFDPFRVPPDGWNGSFEFAAVQDGVIVGWGGPGGIDYQATLSFVPCDLALSTLPVGEYELYGAAWLTIDGQDAYLLGEPSGFAVVPEGPTLNPQQHRPDDSISDAPPADRRAPLPDGEYLALVNAVDAATQELEADLKVWYTGKAAEDFVAASDDPGVGVPNGYAVGDPDGDELRGLLVRDDAPVWEWCSGIAGIEVVQRPGGLAEWAAASRLAANRECSDGAGIARSGLYWLYVRDAVVVLVVAQYTP